jgi:hypothetical protein
MKTDRRHFETIAAAFKIYGDFLTVEPYGSGHINDTFMGRFNQSGEIVKYIFQRINVNVFRKPVELMDNISRCLTHLRGKLAGRHDASRRALTLVSTWEGSNYLATTGGDYWRCYLFVERARTYDVLEGPEQAYAAAKAFGSFQMLLSDLKGPRLHETIPNFHNTPSRLANFDVALKVDVKGRAASAKAEIDFVQRHRHIAPVLLDLLAKGEIPERITHNDTKINNVMLDDESGEGVCVIDLDTVMPGLSAYDFGDLVRTSVSPAAEDERDLSKVALRMDVFEALIKGFLEGYNGHLGKRETELLPFAGALITFEIGLRFLTDHLDGDKYFKIHRDNHNLDRCRTQFRLVELIEGKMDELNKIAGSFK